MSKETWVRTVMCRDQVGVVQQHQSVGFTIEFQKAIHFFKLAEGAPCAPAPFASGDLPS